MSGKSVPKLSPRYSTDMPLISNVMQNLVTEVY